MRELLLKNILRLDSLAGLCNGVAVLSLQTWIARVYELPASTVHFVGWTNLAYGLFGLFNLALARRACLFAILICGNFLWSALLLGFVVLNWNSLNAMASTHAWIECVFVGGVALLETVRFGEISASNRLK